jgi:hypothetical protein
MWFLQYCNKKYLTSYSFDDEAYLPVPKTQYYNYLVREFNQELVDFAFSNKLITIRSYYKNLCNGEELSMEKLNPGVYNTPLGHKVRKYLEVKYDTEKTKNKIDNILSMVSKIKES